MVYSAVPIAVATSYLSAQGCQLLRHLTVDYQTCQLSGLSLPTAHSQKGVAMRLLKRGVERSTITTLPTTTPAGSRTPKGDSGEPAGPPWFGALRKPSYCHRVAIDFESN